MQCSSNCTKPEHEPWCWNHNLIARQEFFKNLFKNGFWRCNDCEKILPLSDFYLRKRNGKPTSAKCKVHTSLSDKRTNWKYNIDYESLLAKQGGLCALCGTSQPQGKGKFHVDHDHKCCPGKRSCGKCVRGLLCIRCNSGIGYFDDDPDLMRKAIAYVEAR